MKLENDGNVQLQTTQYIGDVFKSGFLDPPFTFPPGAQV